MDPSSSKGKGIEYWTHQTKHYENNFNIMEETFNKCKTKFTLLEQRLKIWLVQIEDNLGLKNEIQTLMNQLQSNDQERARLENELNVLNTERKTRTNDLTTSDQVVHILEMDQRILVKFSAFIEILINSFKCIDAVEALVRDAIIKEANDKKHAADGDSANSTDS